MTVNDRSSRSGSVERTGRWAFRETLKPVLFPVHPAGWPFIAAFAGVTVLLGLLWSPFLAIGGALTIWCVCFFRDPDRITPVRPGLVVSPADGKVQSVSKAVPPPELDLGMEALPRVSIFMNVFDCHVNRAPVDGQVDLLAYRPGKFINASLDKASEDNERQSVRIAMADGRAVGCVQIAGLVARRILCWLQPEQTLRAGERIGMIRFGSRVDVYLPEGTAPLVVVGQTAIAGETVLADLASTELGREGEIR